jgi:hypothetical protein
MALGDPLSGDEKKRIVMQVAEIRHIPIPPGELRRR